MNTLKAEKRSLDIKAKKLRREGFVTGNVFGREMNESVPVKIQKKDLDAVLKTTAKGGQIMLDIDGEQYDVLVKDIQYNAMKREIDEISFQALVSNEKIHSVAEVILLNHNAVQDGVVQLLLPEISYKALPAALVEKVEIDVSRMHVGDSIKVKDLEIAKDKDIDLKTDPEAVVVTVSQVHNDIPAADAGEEAAE
ncbi:MAG: 50S ribosomal protein L25 [Lachnospiraceae bacterium]|nr:50S ribosomal protein L25 [Lachnospiraceae bacterium]MDY4971730.1 50S ribosomal protein L25 [Lachnospiraceae bacterium]